MNLLKEKWIPVIRAGGEDFIAPYEISSRDNPVLSLNAPRADFNGAIAQFLIGLLQTALPELKKADWRKWRQTAPVAEELQKLFLPLESAFNFDEAGPRFMQDFDLLDGEKTPISALFIEQPGEQTLKLNTDHFIKRNSIEQLCFHCASIALFTLQINAPSGGAGHRTSLRGGGPLTTLVISDSEEIKSLWDILWLNVIPEKKDFEFYINNDSPGDPDITRIFPWCTPTRTSKSESGATYPQHVHPFQMYWCMPRRIRFDFKNIISGECHVCGNTSDKLLQQYITKNYGINYEGAWEHPLSPYRFDKDKLPIPLHPQPGGIGYKYWQAIMLDYPAAVVKARSGNDLKIWAFGYDMDNMKARCWYETFMPFYHVKEGVETKLASNITIYLGVAKLVLKYLYIALKETNTHSKTVESNFWEETQHIFYEVVHETVNNINQDENTDLENVKEKWLKSLQEKVLELFDRYADFSHAELALIQRLVIARNQLRKNLYGPKARREVELSEKEVKA